VYLNINFDFVIKHFVRFFDTHMDGTMPPWVHQIFCANECMQRFLKISLITGIYDCSETLLNHNDQVFDMTEITHPLKGHDGHSLVII
jgi:hypothetical protein